MIPGSGKSAGEGIGYPLQHSWASLVAQLVKNPPARWETWVRSLGWEEPLEKGKATHSSIVHGVSESQTRLSNFHFHFSLVQNTTGRRQLPRPGNQESLQELARQMVNNVDQQGNSVPEREMPYTSGAQPGASSLPQGACI